MSLHLFDSATHEIRPFTPLVAGKVSIYLCGATVQGVPHVGHARSAIAFDVLVRWLRRSGLEVTLVRNVTDIDDKILSKATDAGVPWWAWAYDNERAFTAAYEALGVLPPTYEPRATGHVPEMIQLMQELIDAGHAYQGGPGDVFFDVRSWADYGQLTRQRLDDVAPEDSSVAGKRDPRDFALWKAPKPGEPEDAAWETPFGRGRPGWHLECSAMARRYLGHSFDIHGGGLDLRFPHHENELAQSRAAGDGFAATWLHNGLVTSSGSKMSKSSNNFLTVAEQLEITPAIVLRYALTVAQYRSQLEWSEQTLADATAAWARIDGFVERASAVADVDAAEVATATLPAAFVAAMDDDLNVPAAIAVVHETVRSGNAALAAGTDVRDDLLATRAMLDVLGVDPGAAHWSHDGGGAAAAVLDALDALVADQLAARAAARTAKEWALADSIRDRLAAVGIQVEDSADGARWSVARREAL